MRSKVRLTALALSSAPRAVLTFGRLAPSSCASSLCEKPSSNGTRFPAGDSRDKLQHLSLRNALAVRITQHRCNSRACRCHGRKSGVFYDPGADYVPRIRQNQNSWALMQLPQLLRFPGLLSCFHKIFSARRRINPHFSSAYAVNTLGIEPIWTAFHFSLH